MRFTLTEPSDLEANGFDKNDIFDYRDFGEGLANLVSNTEGPLVITFDGCWGSGKSVFIRQWAGLIRSRGGNVVYFDAFANDFHSDAFLALASEIYSLAKKTLGGNNSSTRKFLNKAKKVGEALAPRTLDILLRIGTSETVNLKDIKVAAKALENQSEKVISEKLRKIDEERASLEAFRNSLSDVSKSIAKKNQSAGQSLPMVFIVDELDRCRPSFSLDIIERIKHLFSVENICFVLVTNLSQLEAAVKSTYGMETEARTYLEKFYHHKVGLPKSKNKSQKQREKYLTYLWENLKPNFGNPSLTKDAQKEIQRLANVYELSLREIEHVLRNVVLAAAATKENQLFIPPVVAGLCIMRLKDIDLYERAQENKLSWDSVDLFLRISGGADDKSAQHRNHVTGWWRCFVDPDAQNEERLQPYLRNLAKQRLLDRRLSLLHVFTDLIDNFSGDYAPK